MTFKNLAKHMVLLVITLSLTSIFISSLSAQEDDDPVIFIIGEGSTYIKGEGWYAGYVICGQSGTYKLNISPPGAIEHIIQ